MGRGREGGREGERGAADASELQASLLPVLSLLVPVPLHRPES